MSYQSDLPEKQNHRIWIYIKRDLNFKELAHMIVRFDESRIWWRRLARLKSWLQLESCNSSPKAVRPETQEGADVAVQVPKQSAGRFSLAQERSVFCSFQTFNWLHEAHPHYRRQSAFSKYTNLNINPIQNHPQRNILNHVWPNMRSPHRPHKLTHKVNHQRYEWNTMKPLNENTGLYVLKWIYLQDTLISGKNKNSYRQ